MIRYMTGAICSCGKKLKNLEHHQGWGIVECSCGEWFDTDSYRERGGKLVQEVPY